MSADLMLAVTDRNQAAEFAAWLQGQGAALVLTMLGRGTAKQSVLDCLGLEATEKAVLTCVLPTRKDTLRRAARELWLDVPGRGVMVALPMASIGGAVTRDHLLQEEGEERMPNQDTHRLIIAIANQGATEAVMEAARGAGATGGTTIHAKGTGTELAKKFFGVSLAAEKELILILSQTDACKDIMKAIIEKAGMQTESQTLVFSLPVSDLAGVRDLKEER